MQPLIKQSKIHQSYMPNKFTTTSKFYHQMYPTTYMQNIKLTYTKGN